MNRLDVITIKKKSLFLFLLVILGVGIVYSALCFQSGHSGQQGHDSICSMASHSCIYIGAGLPPLFILAFIGVFLLTNITFIPEGFVFSLFKPPRFHA